MGGWEYVSDFLIGPETYGDAPDLKAKMIEEENDPQVNISLAVHHGDSGMLLFIEACQQARGCGLPREKTNDILPVRAAVGKGRIF
jgi:hypothetical protein